MVEILKPVTQRKVFSKRTSIFDRNLCHFNAFHQFLIPLTLFNEIFINFKKLIKTDEYWRELKKRGRVS